MNDDAFEKKLESLAGSLSRTDPTPSWKADMLARARREAGAVTATSSRALPPRWLMCVWCAAWGLIAIMHFTTPVDHTATAQSTYLAASPSEPGTGKGTQGDAPTTLTLLAFHRELSAASTSFSGTP